MNARNAAFKAIEDFFRKVSKTTTLTKSKSCSHLLSYLAMNNDFLQQGGKAKFGLSVSHLLDPLYMSLHSVSLIQKSFIYDLGYSQTLNSIFSAMFNPCHISSRNSCLLLCILVLLNISENVTSGIYWVIDKRLSQPMLFDASEKGRDSGFHILSPFANSASAIPSSIPFPRFFPVPVCVFPATQRFLCLHCKLIE